MRFKLQAHNPSTMSFNGLIRVLNHKNVNTATTTGVILSFGALGGVHGYINALTHKPYNDVCIGAMLGTCVGHAWLKALDKRPIAVGIVSFGPALYARVVDDPFAPFD